MPRVRSPGFFAKCVAGAAFRRTDIQADNIAGGSTFDLIGFGGAQPQNPLYRHFLAIAHVAEFQPCRDFSTKEADGHPVALPVLTADIENQRADRFFHLALPHRDFPQVVDSRPVQAIANRVKQRTQSMIMEGTAAEHWDQGTFSDCPAECFLEQGSVRLHYSDSSVESHRPPRPDIREDILRLLQIRGFRRLLLPIPEPVQ